MLFTARSFGWLFKKQDFEAGAELQKVRKQNYLRDP
jgi:hypothetical protein